LLELVKTFPEVGFSKQLRLAILYRSDPHKRARLFGFLSTLHGWNVRAFGEFEAALLWLSASQEAPAESRQACKGHPIPIRYRGVDTGGQRGTVREDYSQIEQPARRDGPTTAAQTRKRRTRLETDPQPTPPGTRGSSQA
jgi:hypothetical protein